MTRNRLTAITQGSSVVAFVYDAANRRTQLTLPNGVTVDYGYDAASKLISLTYNLGANTLGDLTLTTTSMATEQRLVVPGRTGLPAALASATYDAGNQVATWPSRQDVRRHGADRQFLDGVEPVVQKTRRRAADCLRTTTSNTVVTEAGGHAAAQAVSWLREFHVHVFPPSFVRLVFGS